MSAPPCVPPAMRRRPPCPVCGRESTPEHRPFCSARCKDVDLARWLGGRYVVAGDEPAAEPGAD
ncbi:MAG: DNA gyrase inhibitor YacG [Rubellimicrobium sp.]|nr:DNA gyrase inhibitor YacG [Rubellimicrobium sp.]